MSGNAQSSRVHLMGLIVVLAIVWVLWSGHFTGLLLSLGAVSCLLVTYLSFRMGIVDEEGQPLTWGAKPIVYLPWLTKEVIKANIDVALRVLGIKPVAPAVEWIEVDMNTDLGRVLYADSITLTPGTVSIELERERVLVHALSPDGLVDLKGGEMARRVKQLEGGAQ